VDKPYSQEGENTPCLCCNPKPSWKKREQHLYVVTSYSQVPPMACHLSRKKMKYWQCMAWRAEVGDQFLLSLEDHPESLEELVCGPLAQFIKLSAVDSGLDPSQTQVLKSLGIPTPRNPHYHILVIPLVWLSPQVLPVTEYLASHKYYRDTALAPTILE
jgi:hypothetical protein